MANATLATHTMNGSNCDACTMHPTHHHKSTPICEAYAEDPDEFRSARSPVAVDLNDSRVIYPNNRQPLQVFGEGIKNLDLSRPEDH